MIFSNLVTAKNTRPAAKTTHTNRRCWDDH